ncbi:protease inhibitor I42 family protein [Anaerosoma tenue]|uniref:protease inhibitor I42 family protein n=1 Tax=Anaerosoma tenue TaxID=2933588 RepID=UPI002260FF4E|nr:protease inhibitor I42 family protein [Anaerosoma tenue]MCK8114040.1 protease inhibitor I42 family protein [Anaerosoma tenue]
MMRFMRILTAAAVAGALLSAAGCSAAADVTVTGEDDGGTVTVRDGGTLTVELDSNPTTGYTWLEASVPGVLEARGEPVFEPESDALGARGVQTLTYDVVGTGEGTLELEYARAFESVQPEDTFSVTVVVEE